MSEADLYRHRRVILSSHVVFVGGVALVAIVSSVNTSDMRYAGNTCARACTLDANELERTDTARPAKSGKFLHKTGNPGGKRVMNFQDENVCTHRVNVILM